MGGSPPAWLTARPVAHRGLHDAAAGRPENTLAAAAAALQRGFTVECDVQRSADGEAMVFHDAALERLTEAKGLLADRQAQALTVLTLRDSASTIPRLSDLLDTLGGRVPLVCEIKSLFDGDTRLADRTLEILVPYPGPVALKSFDPAVVAHLRRVVPDRIPLGIVAEARYDHPEWQALAPALRRDLAALAHFGDTRPDFLSFAVDDLPHAATSLMRAALGRPVMTWTVRSAAQRERAALWADQMVFEGFVPDETPHGAALV